jgi:PKD repeat protein
MITSYAWSFGDTTAGSGVTASHTYQAGGTYTVGLVVMDNIAATGLLQISVVIYGIGIVEGCTKPQPRDIRIRHGQALRA